MKNFASKFALLLAVFVLSFGFISPQSASALELPQPTSVFELPQPESQTVNCTVVGFVTETVNGINGVPVVGVPVFISFKHANGYDSWVQGNTDGNGQYEIAVMGNSQQSGETYIGVSPNNPNVSGTYSPYSITLDPCSNGAVYFYHNFIRTAV